MIIYLWAQMSHKPERWADNRGQTLCSCLDGCRLCLLSHTFVIVTALRNCFDKKDFNLLFSGTHFPSAWVVQLLIPHVFQSDFQMYPQAWWSRRKVEGKRHLFPVYWSFFLVKFTSVLIAGLCKNLLDQTPRELWVMSC